MPPEIGIGGVRHHQQPRRRKHRHGLVHRVDHRLAELQIGAVAAGLGHLGRNILDQKRQPAVGVRPAGDTVGLPAGQAPGLFEQSAGGGLLQVGDGPAPGQVVPGLRQHGALAQRVEERGQRGPRRQEIRGEAGEVGERRVEQRQLPRAVEHGKSDRQMREGPGQRLGERPQCGLRLHGGVRRHRKPVPGALVIRAKDVEPPRRRPARGHRLPAAGRRRRIEQLRQRPGQCVVVAQRLDRQIEVGTVAPDHLSGCGTLPHRHRCRRDAGAQAVKLVLQGAADQRALSLEIGAAGLRRQPQMGKATAVFRDKQRRVPVILRGHERQAAEVGQARHANHRVGEPHSQPGRQPLPGRTLVQRPIAQKRPRRRGRVDQTVAVEQELHILAPGGKDAVGPRGARRDQTKQQQPEQRRPDRYADHPEGGGKVERQGRLRRGQMIRRSIAENS